MPPRKRLKGAVAKADNVSLIAGRSPRTIKRNVKYDPDLEDESDAGLDEENFR